MTTGRIASFPPRILENGRFNETESMYRQRDIEPYWQDEDDWLCTVEFLPSNDPEGRVFAADIVGYLLGYAQLTNARALALVGDPEAGAYELLFSFSTPADKNQFLDLVRSNEDIALSHCRGRSKLTLDRR